MIHDKDALYGDELLIGVFRHFNKRTFKAVDQEDIILAFYKARQTKKYDEFFVNYSFDTNSGEVISGDMSSGLDILQETRLLSRKNPDMVDYSVCPVLNRCYEKDVKKKMTAKQERKLKDMARIIEQELHKPIQEI